MFYLQMDTYFIIITCFCLCAAQYYMMWGHSLFTLSLCITQKAVGCATATNRISVVCKEQFIFVLMLPACPLVS